jgi:small GTP-binding protein
MKVVLVGDAQVGKTSILNRLTTGIFNDHSSATVGAAFQTHVVATRDSCVTMQIWDTAGQEKYRALAPMYYRSAEIAILCFDVTNPESFRAAEIWAEELATRAAEDLKIIIVGNKMDLTPQRLIDETQGRQFALHSKAAAYFECSAKTGAGITEIFAKAAELLAEGTEVLRQTTVIEPQIISEQENGKCC